MRTRVAAVVLVAALLACGRFDNGSPMEADAVDGGAPPRSDGGMPNETTPTGTPDGAVNVGPADSGATTNCPGIFCEDFEGSLEKWAPVPSISGVSAKIDASGAGHAFFVEVKSEDAFSGQQLHITRPRLQDTTHVRVEFAFFLAGTIRPTSIMELVLFQSGGERARTAFAVDASAIAIQDLVLSESPATEVFSDKMERWISGVLEIDLAGAQPSAFIEADGGHHTSTTLPGITGSDIDAIGLDCGLDATAAGLESFRVGYDNVILKMEP